MAKSEMIVRKMLCHGRIETKTPLRIASGFDDGIVDILLLKDKEGNALIPATSLAGVLQAQLRLIYGDEACNMFFGCSDADGDDGGRPSLLTVSDITLSGAEFIVRDGVKIDSLTGTAEKGAKFDFEALDRGAEGDLRLELTLRQYHTTHMPQIAFVHDEFAAKGDVYGDMFATIADLLTRGITVGSLTTKGFGEIASKKELAVYDLPFEDNGAADSWLRYVQKDWKEGSADSLGDCLKRKASYSGKRNTVETMCNKQCIVELRVGIKSALIIRDFNKDSQTEAEKAAKLSAIQLRSGKDFVIPGSSIKGVIRNRAVRIVRALMGTDLARAEKFVASFMGYSNKNESRKSHLAVNEVYISPGKVKEQIHSRNRIDRLTGGTIRGALFSDQPIWQDSPGDVATMRFTLTNGRDAEVGLLLLIIRDIWLGTLAFGGNKGIGRGVLQGHSCLIQYKGQSYRLDGESGHIVEGDKAQLEQYVQALVGECHG